MRFLITIAKAYPGQSALILVAVLFAGIAEGFGFSAMLPMLSTVVSSRSGAELMAFAGNAENNSAAERLVRESLDTLGLPQTLEVLLLVILVAIGLKSILVLVANKRVGYTVAHVATDLRLALLRALLASRWEYHIRQPVGGLGNALATETQRSCTAYHAGVLMIIALFQALIYIGVAFLVSWKATLIAVAAGLALFYGLKHLIVNARQAGLRQTKLLKSLVAHLIDNLQLIKPLKAMALEKLAESILFKETMKLNRALRKQVLSKEYLRALQEPLRALLLLTGLYAALVYQGLPLNSVLVLLFLIARVLIQLGKVQTEYQKMVILESAYWSLINTIREAEKDEEPNLGERVPILDKALRLDRLSFAYGENQILRNISVTFPAGRISAIVGPSGSGKTTIVDLVTGLLRANQGEIWIDDFPLTQVDLQSWRQSIGYVPQESVLLHDTVLNNVTLGDPALIKKDAERALRAAGVWDFVQKMPQGINSTVGERGSKISGGQRQRVAIARALVHKPQLLILDEATSALDPENEAAICETLSKLRGDITILAISHQTAILEIADQAYRLQNGSVVPVVKVHSGDISNSEKANMDSKQEMDVIADRAKLY